MRSNNSERLLFFLHIPKAAGSTLSQIIRRQYDASEVLDSYPATFRHKFAAQDARESARLRYRYFDKLASQSKDRARAFMGHEGFGFHQALARPTTYITLLRDPVDRVISHYYYIRRDKHNRMHKMVSQPEMSLAEFVTSGISNEVDNGQTKFLAGLNTPYLKAGEYGPEILDAARHNLATHFKIVGLMERFDETLILMKRHLGWRWPFYVRANVTQKRPHRRDIAPDTIALIQEANTLDLELYQFASERFVANLQAQDPSFHQELKTFQQLNKLYALWHKAITAARRQIRSLRPIL